jgi:hypothetical protein
VLGLDIIVTGNEMRRLVSTSEIMQFITHSSLYLYKKKGSHAPIDKIVAYEKAVKANPYSKGAVFVSPSKDDLMKGKGYVVTSYETLQEKQQQLSHWTPNTYRGGTYYDFKNRIIKGHERENLKQINVIGFDIDTKNVDLYALYLACEELELPRPNLLLESPRGYQGFFVLETPFYIHKNNEYKALRIAERLSDNIRKALSKYVPIDTNCVPFGFYRIPTKDNILDFYDHPANTSQLLAWSKQFEKKENRTFLRVVYDKNAATIDLTATDWYRALISATNIDMGHHSASRNNALLTLALANYASGHTFEDAYDQLDQFNSNLERPLNKNEFERTLKSAYSGKYKGVKRSYVEGLLELWTNGQARFHGREGWYKFKKLREERSRSHYEEWEEDILAYINANTSPETPFLEASLSLLAETIGIAVSSLKEVLKRSSRLLKRTIGRGRGAVTKWTSRTMLFKNLIQLRQKRAQQIQLAFVGTGNNIQIMAAINESLNSALSSKQMAVELEFLYQHGLAPPSKMII